MTGAADALGPPAGESKDHPLGSSAGPGEGEQVGGEAPEDPLPVPELNRPSSTSADEAPAGASGVRTPAWESVGRRVVVMRHGVTELNLRNVVQGQLDTPLSDGGREQARHAAPFVARLNPQRIISSDLRRAFDTAAEIAAHLGLTVKLDERLRESHSGAWQGIAVDDLDPRPNWHTFGVEDKRGGSGESVLDVAARVRPLLDDLLERLPPEGTALLVTHGVTARAITAEIIGMEQNDAWRSIGGLRNCAWAVIEENEAGWRLRSWNLTAPDQADLGLSADSG